MSESAVCVACGESFRAGSMDMTGRGWRCNMCSTAAQVEAYDVGSDMQFHHTRSELDDVVKRANRETLIGVVLIIGGSLWAAAELILFGWMSRWGGGGILGGAATCIHGRWLRRRALIGKEQLSVALAHSMTVDSRERDSIR